jgi:hypothetical protein
MDKRTCTATNKRGEPCGARAIERGLCAVHSGKVNPAEIGRRGGSRSPLTKLRRAADDELRDKAKAALVDALDGDDEKRRFDAAKTLYSFRAAAPPAGEQARGQQSEGKPINLTDLFAPAAESKFFSQLGALDVDTEWRMLERLREQKPPSDVDDAAHIAHPLPPQESTSKSVFGVPSSAGD